MRISSKPHWQTRVTPCVPVHFGPVFIMKGLADFVLLAAGNTTGGDAAAVFAPNDTTQAPSWNQWPPAEATSQSWQ